MYDDGTLPHHTKYAFEDDGNDGNDGNDDGDDPAGMRTIDAGGIVSADEGAAAGEGAGHSAADRMATTEETTDGGAEGFGHADAFRTPTRVSSKPGTDRSSSGRHEDTDRDDGSHHSNDNGNCSNDDGESLCIPPASAVDVKDHHAAFGPTGTPVYKRCRLSY